MLQTGLERVVRMGLTIGLIVWVFQSQAEMDRRVYRSYIDIRKYALTSCVDSVKSQYTAALLTQNTKHTTHCASDSTLVAFCTAQACAFTHAGCIGHRTLYTVVLIACSAWQHASAVMSMANSKELSNTC